MNIHWYDTRDEILKSLNWQKGTLEYWVNNPADATNTRKVQEAAKKLQEAIEIIQQATIKYDE